MKAIHNIGNSSIVCLFVVLYPKDTEKWKQFTTVSIEGNYTKQLFCIPKILKNESNSQQCDDSFLSRRGCFVSQRYWKMKAIHNLPHLLLFLLLVVLYPKDTEKWKQFTTEELMQYANLLLFCIPKILKNESNSQHDGLNDGTNNGCFVSQRYWKMKAIHNVKFVP